MRRSQFLYDKAFLSLFLERIPSDVVYYKFLMFIPHIELQSWIVELMLRKIMSKKQLNFFFQHKFDHLKSRNEKILEDEVDFLDSLRKSLSLSYKTIYVLTASLIENKLTREEFEADATNVCFICLRDCVCFGGKGIDVKQILGDNKYVGLCGNCLNYTHLRLFRSPKEIQEEFSITKNMISELGKNEIIDQWGVKNGYFRELFLVVDEASSNCDKGFEVAKMALEMDKDISTESNEESDPIKLGENMISKAIESERERYYEKLRLKNTNSKRLNENRIKNEEEFWKECLKCEFLLENMNKNEFFNMASTFYDHGYIRCSKESIEQKIEHIYSIYLERSGKLNVIKSIIDNGSRLGFIDRQYTVEQKVMEEFASWMSSPELNKYGMCKDEDGYEEEYDEMIYDKVIGTYIQISISCAIERIIHQYDLREYKILLRELRLIISQENSAAKCTNEINSRKYIKKILRRQELRKLRKKEKKLMKRVKRSFGINYENSVGLIIEEVSESLKKEEDLTDYCAKLISQTTDRHLSALQNMKSVITGSGVRSNKVDNVVSSMSLDTKNRIIDNLLEKNSKNEAFVDSMFNQVMKMTPDTNFFGIGGIVSRCFKDQTVIKKKIEKKYRIKDNKFSDYEKFNDDRILEEPKTRLIHQHPFKGFSKSSKILKNRILDTSDDVFCDCCSDLNCESVLSSTEGVVTCNLIDSKTRKVCGHLCVDMYCASVLFYKKTAVIACKCCVNSIMCSDGECRKSMNIGIFDYCVRCRRYFCHKCLISSTCRACRMNK